MKRFENAQVGDLVYCRKNGEGEIMELDRGSTYPVDVRFENCNDTYTLSGLQSTDDVEPVLFFRDSKSNYYERREDCEWYVPPTEEPEFEKWCKTQRHVYPTIKAAFYAGKEIGQEKLSQQIEGLLTSYDKLAIENAELKEQLKAYEINKPLTIPAELVPVNTFVWCYDDEADKKVRCYADRKRAYLDGGTSDTARDGDKIFWKHILLAIDLTIDGIFYPAGTEVL